MEKYSLDRQKGNSDKEEIKGRRDMARRKNIMHMAMMKEMEGKTTEMRETRKKRQEETKKMTT